MVEGIARADFEDFIFADWKKSVTRTPVVETEDPITGDHTLTDGTPETIYAIFIRHMTQWMHEQTGELQKGDAYLMVKYDQTLVKNDKITAYGNTYRVDDVLNIYADPGQSVMMCKYANLFLNT